MSPAMIPVFVDVGDLTAAGFVSGSFPLWDGDNFTPFSNYQQKYTRVVVVDKGGKGDYSTIKDACDYAVANPPTNTNPLLIQVMPGIYTELPFVIPGYTSVVGPSAYAAVLNLNAPATIKSDASWTSGTFIGMSGSRSALVNFHVTNTSFTPTGDVAAITLYASAFSVISNCYVQFNFANAETYRCNVIRKSSGLGGPYLLFSSFYLSLGAGVGTNAQTIYSEGGGATFYMSYCNLQPGSTGRTGIGILFNATVTNSTPVIAFTRIGSTVGRGFDTYDLQITGSAQVFYINNSPIRQYTGAVAFLDRFFTSNAGIREASSAGDCPTASKGAVGQTANLREEQDSNGVVLRAVGPAGQIKTNQHILSGTAVGTLIGFMPYYSPSGTFVGYGPLYSDYS